jgi:hypothetical protein
LNTPIIFSEVVTPSDRQRAVAIMAATFEHNPAVWFSIGKGGNSERKAHVLAQFLVNFATDRNGLFLSSDRNGVMVAYRSDAPAPALRTLYHEIKLVFGAVGLIRVFRVLRRSQRVHHQQRFSPFIHCWYIGVVEEARHGNAARELQHRLCDMSREMNLPVLAETTILRNKKAYEFIGFETYGEVQSGDMTTWLLVRK